MRAIIGLLGLCILLSGCFPSMGSQTIRRNYSTYNETIHYNQSQQMLLNLVRMRFRESPLFLKVGAVSASYAFEVTGGARAGSVLDEPDYGVQAGGTWAERPTVTYTPVEGDTFVKQMLTEVDQSTLFLLFRAGWPIEALCHILVEQIGSSYNSPDDATYPEFERIVESLAAAQREHRLTGTVVDKKVILQVKDAGSDAVQTLPLDSVHLRSFLDIMFVLGKGTQVPSSQQDQVKSAVSNGWLDVRYSEAPPEDALVWVEYNGFYYGIARNDVRSKDTFSLLKQLFEMQAGDIKTVQPVLTLPVATP